MLFVKSTDGVWDSPHASRADVEQGPAQVPASESGPRGGDLPPPAGGGGGPLVHSIALATWALFVGIGLLLVGAGLFGTLISVRAELDGFGSLVIGLISAAYYGGFLAGSRLTLRLLHEVGHIRVYAALASTFAAAIVLAGMTAGPWSWIALRFVAGACLAGQYVVAESWLNQLVTSRSRARLLSRYTVLTVVAFGIGQLWFTRLDPTAVTGFGIAAVLIALAVTPVALSVDARPPTIAQPVHLPLRELFGIAPTGAITSTLVGIAHGAFLGLGAVYAARSGLSIGQIGLFVLMPTLGSLLLSIPISSLSDRRDRRLVGVLAAAAAVGAAAMLLLLGPDTAGGFVAMAVLGGVSYPLYTIAGAYTNDWVPEATLTAVASHLVMLFGIGALVGPLLASILMAALGADGYVWAVLGAHVVIVTFLLVRILQHPAAERAKPWNAVNISGRALYLPSTVVSLGRRMRPQAWRAPRPTPPRCSGRGDGDGPDR